jgi:signal transduction histidine kinase
MFEPRSNTIAGVLALVCGSIAALSLFGALTSSPLLRGWIEGRTLMSNHTAIAIALLGAGVIARGRGLLHVATGCGAAASAIAGWTLCEYLGGSPALYATQRAPHGAGYAGWMAIHTATALLLLGFGLAVFSARNGKVREVCALFAALIGYVALVGHAFGAESLWIFAHTHMALNTALCLLLLATAMALSTPHGWVMSELARGSEGGVMARRLLPVALLIPPVVGWLRLLGERAGAFDSRDGTTILVVSNALLLCAATVWAARVANRVSGERERARSALHDAQIEREVRVRFVRSLAHDLRTPLASIRAGAERLSRAELSDLRERLGAVVLRGVDRLDHMICDLLDVERLRAGHSLTLRMVRCDVAALVEEVAQDQGLMREHGLLVDVARPLRATVDPDALRRVLENLIGNAFKYGAAGTAVQLRARSTDDEILISVHNVGDPISASELEGLFEPFARRPTRAAHSGWGIGLALVRGLVEAHEGRVEVESSEAAGTTFTIVLPSERSATAESGTRANPPHPAER